MAGIAGHGRLTRKCDGYRQSSAVQPRIELDPGIVQLRDLGDDRQAQTAALAVGLVTALEALRQRHAAQVKKDGGRLTLTVFAAKAAVAEELADVLCYALAIANELDIPIPIDLFDELSEKTGMAYDGVKRGEHADLLRPLRDPLLGIALPHRALDEQELDLAREYILEAYENFVTQVAEARELGFTEPDPREDLAGRDVARKALIIAREIGVEIEMDDLSCEAMLPASLMDLPDVDSFMRRLPEGDAPGPQPHAEQFLRFLTTKRAQDVLRSFGKDRYGEPMYRDAAYAARFDH